MSEYINWLNKKRMMIIWILLLHIASARASSISNPFNAQSKLDQVIPDYFDTKNRHKLYYNNTPLLLHNVSVVRYDSDDQDCNIDVNVKWSATIGSSVYAPPVIFDGVNGKKQIFLTTFYQYIEVLGYDGFKPWGKHSLTQSLTLLQISSHSPLDHLYRLANYL